MFRLLLTLLLTLGLTHSSSADKPNVVVFLVDDMGLMDTSVPFLVDADGKPERHPLNDFYRTPNMARLAAQGIRFSTFYANSVCSPTRVSIMTGQSSARHHTTQYIKPESNNRGSNGPPAWQWAGITKDQLTLPALLRQAGYRTIHAGKAHFGPNGSFGSEPLNIGFDVNVGGCAYGQPGSYSGKKNYGHGMGGRAKRAVPGLEKYHGTDTHLTDACTIEFKAAVEASVKNKQPFFGYLAHYAVHAPFEPDPRFVGNYPKAGKRAAAYASLIEGMDKSLGDVLDHLQALGIAENTLVLFLGDNGSDSPLGGTHAIASSAPLRAKKGTHYEGGMRVPFIAAWAKPDPNNPHQQRLPILANALQSQLGDVTELFPTIANLTATPVPADHALDGHDLAKRLSGANDPEKPATFLMHFPHNHRSSYFTAYRQGDWKLVYHYGTGKGKQAAPRYELFNLAKDPTEANNLANSNPEQLRTIIQAMQRQLEAAGAQYAVDAEGRELRPSLP